MRNGLLGRLRVAVLLFLFCITSVLVYLAYVPKLDTADLSELHEGGDPASAGNVHTTIFPDTPVGSQLAWALAQINSAGEGFTEQSVREHLSPGVIGSGTVAALRVLSCVLTLRTQGTDLFESYGPLRLVGFWQEPGDFEAEAAVMNRRGEIMALTGETETNAPYRLIRFWMFEIDD